MPRLSGAPTARFGATQPSASCTAFRTLLPRYKTPDNRAVAAATSKTLYVGNLAFVTTEQQIIEVFRRCGPVKQVIMGLNRESRKPCGFAFVMCVPASPRAPGQPALHAPPNSAALAQLPSP